MKYEIYQDKRGEWRWRLKAANGKILAMSSEGYWNKRDCWDCIDKVQSSANVPVIGGK